MLELSGGGGLFGMSHSDDLDYRSSENPLLLLGGGGNNNSSSRLIVNHDYSDSPSLMMMMRRNNNNNIGFSSKFSQPTTTTTKPTSFDQSTGDNQRNIEFTTTLPRPYDDDNESDGATSPPLWKNTSNNRITEGYPWQTTRRPYYHNRFLTPLTTTNNTHRFQEIARGRQELMEMIKNMPENSYELSLKDLIEKPAVDDSISDESELNSTNNNNISSNGTTSSMNSSREVKNETKGRMLKRSKSMDSSNNGPFLLKMFLPFSGFGSNKKKKKKKRMKKGSTNYYAKVSPKPSPPLMEGDQKATTTTVDKEWWKKRFSIAGGDHTTTTETNGGLESIGESSGGSTNSSGRSRRMGGFLNGCWSMYTKKTKTMALKGSDF